MSDDIFNDIFYFHKDIMLLLDKLTGKIIKANFAAQKFYGYDEKTLMNKTAGDLEVYENDILYHKTANNDQNEVDTNAINLNGHGKELQLLIINDTNDNLSKDKSNLESIERINYALENAGDGVWDRNLETNKVFFSKKWKEMLGFNENEITNSFFEWHKRVHSDDIEGTMKQLKDHLDGIIPYYRSEYRILCKDGNYKWILDRGKVTTYKRGKPSRMIGIHTDLTEFKKIEEELYQSNKRKDTLLSIVSHDLRGPIGSFRTLINFIIENFQDFDPNEILAIVKDMKKTSSSIYDLLDNLLNWAQTNRDKTNLFIERLRIIDLIKFTEENLALMLESKNIKLKLDIDDDMTVNADKNSMTIIFRNILSNAIKFSFPGSMIEINALVSFGKKVIEFIDHGKGIPRDVLEKLENNSLRVSSFGTANEKGSGLGLGLCREMLILNNGMLKIESEEGKGARIKVILI